MPSVGALSFDFQWGGPIPKAGQGLEVWEVPGLAGFGLRQTGARGQPAAWRCVKYDSAANLYTLLNACWAAQGTLVTTVDQFAESVAEVVILRVAVIGEEPVKACIVNGVLAARLEVGFELLKAT